MQIIVFLCYKYLSGGSSINHSDLNHDWVRDFFYLVGDSTIAEKNYMAFFNLNNTMFAYSIKVKKINQMEVALTFISYFGMDSYALVEMAVSYYSFKAHNSSLLL